MTNVVKGSNVIIGESVTLGENVVIGNNVVIYENVTIGGHVTIHDNVVIGKQPMRAKNSALKHSGDKTPPATIKDGCTIGTSSIIYADAHLDSDVFVADLATIRERVNVGSKTIVGRGVAIENDCIVGQKCKLETNCYITAYSVIEDYSFIAPCVVTTNDNYLARTKDRFDKFKGVTVRKGARVGANATILPGVEIEEDGVVAAGSVVTKNVNSREIVAGVPARKLREVPNEQLLENQ